MRDAGEVSLCAASAPRALHDQRQLLRSRGQSHGWLMQSPAQLVAEEEVSDGGPDIRRRKVIAVCQWRVKRDKMWSSKAGESMQKKRQKMKGEQGE